jgi:hypothetical protein
MANRISFTDWLIKQVNRNDPVGDLARDARRDVELPNLNTVKDWKIHLSYRACREAKDALKQAANEYKHR